MQRAAPRQQKDAMGFWLCRMPECGKKVGKGRRSYCSRECAIEFEIRYFPAATRRHVFERDQGVCAKCGCDTEKIARVLKWFRKFAHKTELWERRWCSNGHAATCAIAREIGFANGYINKGELWQADHVVECVRGGWGRGLDNFRTLCTPCHKEETKRLAGELAQQRRENGDMSLFTDPAKVA